MTVNNYITIARTVTSLEMFNQFKEALTSANTTKFELYVPLFTPSEGVSPDELPLITLRTQLFRDRVFLLTTRLYDRVVFVKDASNSITVTFTDKQIYITSKIFIHASKSDNYYELIKIVQGQLLFCEQYSYEWNNEMITIGEDLQVPFLKSSIVQDQSRSETLL